MPRKVHSSNAGTEQGTKVDERHRSFRQLQVHAFTLSRGVSAHLARHGLCAGHLDFFGHKVLHPLREPGAFPQRAHIQQKTGNRREAEYPQVHAARQPLCKWKDAHAIAIKRDGACGHHAGLPLIEQGPLFECWPQAPIGVDAVGHLPRIVYLAVDLG